MTWSVSPPPQKNNFFFKQPTNFGLEIEANRLFQQALALLNQGKMKQARECLEKVIKINSKQYDALNLLGIIAAELKEFNLAETLFEKAIKLNPNNANYYCNAGNVLRELKQLEKALNYYDKAINLKKDYVLAYLNRSMTLCGLKQFEEALKSTEKAITIKPDLAEAYYQHGFIFEELKRFDDALASYEKAIQLEHDYAEAHCGCGDVFFELKQWKKALASYDKAIELKSDFADAYSNRGNLLRELDLYDEALASYDRAIELKHDFVDAYLNRGVLLLNIKNFDEALASFDVAIQHNPDSAESHYSKAIVFLSLQNFKNGWELYEWRWKNPNLKLPTLFSNKPKLNNLNFNYNKKLLILAEQGVGDQILYAGMLDKLFELVPSCQVMLDNRLSPLLLRSFPNRKFLDNIKNSDDVDHDEHISIADLGKIFKSSIDDFDLTRNSYLKADKTRATEIRHPLINDKKFLCGITWSSTTEKIGASKSISLENLLPILGINNIAFVSLQYGDVKSQLIDFNKSNNVNIQDCNTVDNFYDLDGHAALIEACDFVVTISNTSAHFSGTLGKKTYLLCPIGKGSLWYWSNHINGKSIWYPNLHIFEQSTHGQWEDVVQKIKSEIEKSI